MSTSVLVLVVEDEEAIRDLLYEALTEGGSIAVAHEGNDAMTMLDAADADYRALITDVNLPGKINGWDIARRAREINESIPVIYTTEGSAHEWPSLGVPDSLLLRKPFAVVQVVTAVAQMISDADSAT